MICCEGFLWKRFKMPVINDDGFACYKMKINRQTQGTMSNMVRTKNRGQPKNLPINLLYLAFFFA